MTADATGQRREKRNDGHQSGNKGCEEGLSGPHPLSGLCKDAPVLTMNGVRPVQKLRPGDQLVTRGQGAATIRRIEQRSIVTPTVYIIAGSLGHYRTDRDTLLPAAQTIHVRDWRARFFSGVSSMLVRACDLIDGEYVRDLGFMPLTIYQIVCDAPMVIYADGMELGTADAQALAIKSTART